MLSLRQRLLPSSTYLSSQLLVIWLAFLRFVKGTSHPQCMASFALCPSSKKKKRELHGSNVRSGVFRLVFRCRISSPVVMNSLLHTLNSSELLYNGSAVLCRFVSNTQRHHQTCFFLLNWLFVSSQCVYTTLKHFTYTILKLCPVSLLFSVFVQRSDLQVYIYMLFSNPPFVYLHLSIFRALSIPDSL